MNTHPEDKDSLRSIVLGGNSPDAKPSGVLAPLDISPLAIASAPLPHFRWGINTILRHDPHAKIRATNGCIYFGAYSSRDLMTENEQIDMESWGWTSRRRGSKAEWVRRV